MLVIMLDHKSATMRYLFPNRTLVGFGHKRPMTAKHYSNCCISLNSFASSSGSMNANILKSQSSFIIRYNASSRFLMANQMILSLSKSSPSSRRTKNFWDWTRARLERSVTSEKRDNLVTSLERMVLMVRMELMVLLVPLVCQDSLVSRLVE